MERTATPVASPWGRLSSWNWPCNPAVAPPADFYDLPPGATGHDMDGAALRPTPAGSEPPSANPQGLRRPDRNLPGRNPPERNLPDRATSGPNPVGPRLRPTSPRASRRTRPCAAEHGWSVPGRPSPRTAAGGLDHHVRRLVAFDAADRFLPSATSCRLQRPAQAEPDHLELAVLRGNGEPDRGAGGHRMADGLGVLQHVVSVAMDVDALSCRSTPRRNRPGIGVDQHRRRHPFLPGDLRNAADTPAAPRCRHYSGITQTATESGPG